MDDARIVSVIEGFLFVLINKECLRQLKALNKSIEGVPSAQLKAYGGGGTGRAGVGSGSRPEGAGVDER